jgi:hypothetical protein
VEDARGRQGPTEPAHQVEKLDLDGDGQATDVAISFDEACGANRSLNCLWSVYRAREGCFGFVGEIGGKIAVTAEAHGGLHDLESVMSMGGGSYRHVMHELSGSTYREVRARLCHVAGEDEAGDGCEEWQSVR